MDAGAAGGPHDRPALRRGDARHPADPEGESESRPLRLQVSSILTSCPQLRGAKRRRTIFEVSIGRYIYLYVIVSSYPLNTLFVPGGGLSHIYSDHQRGIPQRLPKSLQCRNPRRL